MKDSNVVLGSITTLVAVLLGAFGAHLLEPILEETGRVGNWDTAVSYHFYHGIGILVAGLLLHHFNNKNIQRAIYCFISGIVFFSGSLYALSITDIGMLGAITPLGGVLFILGWLLLAIGARKK